VAKPRLSKQQRRILECVAELEAAEPRPPGRHHLRAVFLGADPTVSERSSYNRAVRGLLAKGWLRQVEVEIPKRRGRVYRRKGFVVGAAEGLLLPKSVAGGTV